MSQIDNIWERTIMTTTRNSDPFAIVFLDSEANEYDTIYHVGPNFVSRMPILTKSYSNDELSELAGQHVLELIIEEYDKCDQPGYEMPVWLTGGIWGFVVGSDGDKEVVRFDWLGCLTLAEEEIKNRPPKIIVPDRNIFVPGSRPIIKS